MTSKTVSMRMIRLVKFVEEMKKNHFPNVPHMMRVLRDADYYEGLPIGCNERTIRRDIQALRDDFHAPIAFDAKRKGFYLTDPDWQFDVPVFVERHVKAPVDKGVLNALFDAVRDHRCVSFTYTPTNGEPHPRTFEPHVVTLYRGIWYVRGYKVPDGERRTYAIQRITDVVPLTDTFKPDRALVADTKTNGPFDFPKITDARLRVDPDAASFFQERAAGEDYSLTWQDDGSLIVDLPPLLESELIRFVLGGFGAVRLIRPEGLRKEILDCAQGVLDANV